jgi:hypothetical protein
MLPNISPEKPASYPPPAPSEKERIAALETKVQQLEAQVKELRERLDKLGPQKDRWRCMGAAGVMEGGMRT